MHSHVLQEDEFPESEGHSSDVVFKCFKSENGNNMDATMRNCFLHIINKIVLLELFMYSLIISFLASLRQCRWMASNVTI